MTVGTTTVPATGRSSSSCRRIGDLKVVRSALIESHVVIPDSNAVGYSELILIRVRFVSQFCRMK